MSETAGIHFRDASGPDGVRLYAIGDVHGCLAQLRAMFAMIDAEIARDAVDDWRIVLLGDYCDRGPDTRGVIDFILERQSEDSRVIALAGNHDDGIVEFLQAAEGNSLFTDCGGDATALSYGVTLDSRTPGTLRLARDNLAAAMPDAHLAFFSGLPSSAEFGDFFFCHAGIRPGVPLAGQARRDLVWIRGAFLDFEGLHPKVIVHGHTPSRAPEVLANRVNVDTGAVFSGQLTALVVDGRHKRLIHA